MAVKRASCLGPLTVVVFRGAYFLYRVYSMGRLPCSDLQRIWKGRPRMTRPTTEIPGGTTDTVGRREGGEEGGRRKEEGGMNT